MNYKIKNFSCKTSRYAKCIPSIYNVVVISAWYIVCDEFWSLLWYTRCVSHGMLEITDCHQYACNPSKSFVPAGYRRRKCNPQFPTVVHWVALRSCKKVHAYQSERRRQRVCCRPRCGLGCTWTFARLCVLTLCMNERAEGRTEGAERWIRCVCYGRYSTASKYTSA